jgi:catecholate siderophore receptor
VLGLASAAPAALQAQQAQPPAAAASAPQPAAAAAPATATATKTLPSVTVTDKAEQPEGKDALRTTTSRIGKGEQALRDIPQSLTVVTEKLIDDRNLDTLKDALRNTGGITFLAAEGGEEDIRLRGFSLATTGDLFVDGMRDPAFYERDTFNVDRLEVLRGSASMLFGRGSTGGAVNQVSKAPRPIDAHEVAIAAGNHGYVRFTGDFNLMTGDDSALRINAMNTQADNNGAGAKLDKHGIAAAWRTGIGSRHDLTFSLYSLTNANGINYGLPWIRPSAAAPIAQATLLPVDPSRYYGMASDVNAGKAEFGTVRHVWRFAGDDGQLETLLRHGQYKRDQRASAIRFAGTTGSPANPAAVGLDNFSDATVLTRGTNNKIQNMVTTYAQSDLSRKFDALGFRHALLAGVDHARERFWNYNAGVPAGQAAALTKPRTRVGTPDDGAFVDETLRTLAVNRGFEARALGVYAQDLVQVAPFWKLLGGLRYDNFQGKYWTPSTTNATTGAVTPGIVRERRDSLWSKRFGILYQPSERLSMHFSYGTSFNTSGDTYQYDDQTVNTPPEGSRNFELGARIESADKRFTTRVALFRSEKTHERNRDPDSAATQNLLSGRRHSAGIELDLAGMLTPNWEVYVSYAFTPIARIDVGAPNVPPGTGEGTGTRPSLTPRHSGTAWTTYKLDPKWRVGAGLNWRSRQTPNRNPGFAAPGFVTADLMAEYAFSSQLQAKLNVTNVGNKLYADALYTGHYVPGAGRLVQLTLTSKF